MVITRVVALVLGLCSLRPCGALHLDKGNVRGYHLWLKSHNTRHTHEGGMDKHPVNPYLYAIGLQQSPLTPIDFVYTWVDSSDPVWKEHHDADAVKVAGNPSLPPDSDVAQRYQGHDELLYSMRSLLQFMEPAALGNIYIVTAGQAPAWLKPDHPKVKVINHHDIIPENLLGKDEYTYNSFAIESWVHKIPNLSEQFVLMNDDFFFGAPVYRSDFFDEKDRPLIAFQTDWGLTTAPTEDRDQAYLWAAYNCDLLLDNVFQDHKEQRYKLLHNAYPTTKSLFDQAHVLFRDNIEATTVNKFRTRTDIIPHFLAAWVGIYRGDAVRLKPEQFMSSTYLHMKDNPQENKDTLLRLLSKSGQYKVFSIGDHQGKDGDDSKTGVYMKEFFASYFNQNKAPWEV